MFFSSLIHQIVLWILLPMACVIGVISFQLHGLLASFSLDQERELVKEGGLIARELQLVLSTTQQLAAMIAQDGTVLLACKNRAADSLYQTGSNIIASTLLNRITFVDADGMVLARGHDEFFFNDSIAGDPFFRLAAEGKSHAAMVRVQDEVAFVVVQPIIEFGAVVRGAVIVSRSIAPQFIDRIGRDLGLAITIAPPPGAAGAPTESTLGLARLSLTLPFDSMDPEPWTLTIGKSYADELKTFNAARSKIFLFTILATATTLIFVYFSVRYLLRPLRRLLTWLQEHKEGRIGVEDLNKNIIAQNNTTNELGHIAHSALATIQELELARVDLERMQQNLERLVEERTLQLSIKTEQLQNEVREREQAETKILGLKNHLQSLFDSMRCALIGVDANGLITFVNVEAERLIGLPLERLQQAPVQQVLQSFSLPSQDFLDHTRQDGDQWQLRRYTVDHNGSPMHLDITTYPFHYDTEAGLIIRIDDVSKQVAMEQELFKVEKLKSIGLLAGGIAHDFNNSLATILGSIDLALLDDRMHEKTRGLLAQAEKASLCAKALTGQLLTFAKGGEPRKQLTDLKAVVRTVADLALVNDHFACRFSIPADLWPAEIDRAQIEQVIDNIVVNATQALSAGEAIDITCTNVASSDDKQLARLAAGPYVRIEVRDKGSGMPAEILSRIFDPYFSTKAEEHGLGLAICYSVIRKHQGKIAVQSSPGEGTTFSIYLPARPDQRVMAEASGEMTTDSRRPLTILVMDDEAMIREVVGAMLDLLGHQALFARDGQEAVSKYKSALEAGTPIDIVLMDLIIPGGMGGKDAVGEIHHLHPQAKVIVSSGYSTDPVLARFKDYGFAAAIGKPYQMKELAGIIAEVGATGTA